MTASRLLDIRAKQGNGPARDAAAGIWARATALRDQLHVIPLLEDKLLGIESALAQDGSLLLMVAYQWPREGVLDRRPSYKHPGGALPGS